MVRMSSPSDADWLRLIQSAAADSAQVRLTAHARERMHLAQRMHLRKVSLREVLNVLWRGDFDEAPVPSLKPPGHWTARLADRTGVAVVVGFDPEGHPIVLDVVTVMRGR